MTKFVDSLGLKRLVTKIAEAVGNGEWLPIKRGVGSDGNVVQGAVAEGGNTTASGLYSHAEGSDTKALEVASHAEGNDTEASGPYSHTEGNSTEANGEASHAEGKSTEANGEASHAEGSDTIAEGKGSHAEGEATLASGAYSHAEGESTTASGACSHAQGSYNHNNPAFIDMVGVGSNDIAKNASVIYVKRDTEGNPDLSDPKNGYQYLLGVGGYQGEDIAEGMKSVQEVIADLEKGVAATETMTVEDIREIMSA